MELATTRSKRFKLPSPSVNAGPVIVFPKAISASMSWMTTFILAMANVAGLISWP